MSKTEIDPCGGTGIRWAIGLGTTSACNLNCAHCYSRGAPADYQTVDSIRGLIDSLDIDSINLGTGENGLNPHLPEMLEYFNDKKIKMSLTSNGYTIAMLSDAQLGYFNDMDVSIDFADERMNDEFRGPGAFEMAIQGVRKCKDAGVETSVACCLTNLNCVHMGRMLDLCDRLDVNLRINVYKPVFTDRYNLTYDQFWDTIKFLFENAKIVSCSEAIVNTLLGIKVLDGGSPCGKTSIRVRPDGAVVPCVYWPKSDISIGDIEREGAGALERSGEFRRVQHIPEECRECEHVDICKGGCAARREFNDFGKADEYCYSKNGREPPDLKYRFAEEKDLVHSSYLCTIILST